MKSLITPKKSLGQNFLINPRILNKIVKATEISKEDVILEVGPGPGNLTEKLAETLRQSSRQAGKVIAIEKDRRLIEMLKEKFSAYGGPAAGWKDTNVEIVEGDILKISTDDLGLKTDNYKIVGNIPYYITSRFLRTVFEDWPKPKLVILTIQKEVAQRITAKPPHMNLLALSVQFFADPKIVGYVSKENFRPRPKVDSAIIKLTPKEKLPADNPEKFFKIIKAGFAGKRKQLANNLSKKFGIIKEELLRIFAETGIQSKDRAENLSLEQWIELSNYIKKY